MGVPPASTGLQLALRGGVAVPLGDAREGSGMSDAIGVQFPLTIDIGGKPIPEVFLGGYVGGAIGGTAGKVGNSCSQSGFSCTATTFRIGVELQYHIAPAAKTNPWIGYGFGYERLTLSVSQGNDSLTGTFSGLELAHFMGGLDFRLTPTFGIGPFVDFALGQYSSTSSDQTVGGRSQSTSGDIDKKALHEWFMLGMRFTFFP